MDMLDAVGVGSEPTSLFNAAAAAAAAAAANAITTRSMRPASGESSGEVEQRLGASNDLLALAVADSGYEKEDEDSAIDVVAADDDGGRRGELYDAMNVERGTLGREAFRDSREHGVSATGAASINFGQHTRHQQDPMFLQQTQKQRNCIERCLSLTLTPTPTDTSATPAATAAIASETGSRNGDGSRIECGNGSGRECGSGSYDVFNGMSVEKSINQSKAY